MDKREEKRREEEEEEKRRKKERKKKITSMDTTNCVWILVWKSSVLYGFEYGICLFLV